jgi:uncharacterized protein YndB with AHSA1/START domain
LLIKIYIFPKNFGVMSKKSKDSSAKKSNKHTRPAGGKAAKPVKKSPAKKIAGKKTVKPASAKPAAGRASNKKGAEKKPVKKVAVKKAAKPVIVKSKAKAAVKKPVKKALPPTKSATKKPPVKIKPAKVEKVKAVKPVKTVIAKKPEPKTPTKKEVSNHITSGKVAPMPKVIEKPAETLSKKQVAIDGKASANEVLAISNTIPKPKVSLISASKIASISSSITNPIRKVDSYSIKSEKEPNGKYEMEIVVRSSPEMLYEFLSTPSGLSEWFCDDVNIRNGIYTFIWEGQLQQARLLKTVDDHLVRFQWVDKIDGSYFEFRIQRDDLTNDISLIVTDFAETVSERESSKLLWHSQVEKLLHIMGSI